MKKALVLTVMLLSVLSLVAFSQAYANLSWQQDGVQSPSMTLQATIGVYSPFFLGGLHTQTYHTFIFHYDGANIIADREDGGWVIYGNNSSYIKVGAWYNSQTDFHFAVVMNLEFLSWFSPSTTQVERGE